MRWPSSKVRKICIRSNPMAALESLARLAAAAHRSNRQNFNVVNDLEGVSLESARHSRRVAARAFRLGERLGLLDERLESLRFAGLVHDIGKLGTPQWI